MTNRFKKSILAVVIGGAAATAGLAFAQTDSAPAAGTTATPATTSPRAADKSNWLDMRQIIDRVEAAGYTDIREIEREKDGYEVKARDGQGRSVKLYLEPVAGKIVKEKVRDDD